MKIKTDNLLLASIISAISTLFIINENISILDNITASNQNSISFLFKTGYLIDIYSQGRYFESSIFQILLNTLFGPWITNVILTIVLIYLVSRAQEDIPSFIIPLLIMSYIYGEIITPILIILLYTSYRNKSIYRDIGNLLLTIHEPILSIPYIYSKIIKERDFSYASINTLAVALMIIFYRYRYTNNTWIKNPWILILIAISYLIFTLSSKRKRGLLIALPLNILTPNGAYALYQTNTLKINSNASRKKMIILLLLILFIIPVLYINHINLVSRNINPNLENFIKTNIPKDDKVLLATNDFNIIETLQKNHNHLIKFDNAMKWNWSNRSFVKQKLKELTDISIKLQCKYIIIEKPKELAYWVSQDQFIEHKYNLIVPRETYVIILNNTIIPEQEKYFYIDELKSQSPSSILRNYTLQYWSNITLDKLMYKNNTIYINSQEPYVIYLKFKTPNNIPKRNYIIVSISSNDTDFTRIRSLEIYGRNETDFKSLWKAIDLPKNASLIVEDINISLYNSLELKIDAKGGLMLKELSIYLRNSDFPYQVQIRNEKIIIKNNLDNNISLKPIFLDKATSDNIILPAKNIVSLIADGINHYILVIAITLLTALLILTLKEREENIEEYTLKNVEEPEENLKKVYLSIIILSLIPIIIYLSYTPHLLEKNWIGGGVFIYAYLMAIATLFIFKIRNYSKLVNNLSIFILILPILVYLGYFIKEKYLLDLINLNSWYIEAHYSMIDTYLYGLIYLLTSLIIFQNLPKKGVGILRYTVFTAPSYLILTASIYLIDLKKLISQEYSYIFLYLTALLVKAFFKLIHINMSISYSAYGIILQAYYNTLNKTVILGWPCAGITGIFLYTGFMAIEYTGLLKKYNILNRSFMWRTFIIGLLITYLLNVMRILAIIYLSLIYPQANIGEFFHSTGYELIFLIWILGYIWIVDSIFKKTLKKT